MAMGATTGLKLGLPRSKMPVAQIGTTEHALIVLVIVELAVLVGIRRVFKAAHGG
jgi:hypothetical protein